MRGSPLVYELEDPGEFNLDPLTDSARPGVQTALQGWMMWGVDPTAPPLPTLRERIAPHRMTMLFVAVMSLSIGVRWMA